MFFAFTAVANVRVGNGGLNIYRNMYGEYVLQDVRSFSLTDPMSQSDMQEVLGDILSGGTGNVGPVSDSEDEPQVFAPDPDEPETPGHAYIAEQKEEPAEAFAWLTEDVSSNISYVKRMTNGDLYVAFKSGDKYRYTGVTQSVVDDWYDTWHDGGSIGAYYNKYIKGEYPAERLTAD